VSRWKGARDGAQSQDLAVWYRRRGFVGEGWCPLLTERSIATSDGKTMADCGKAVEFVGSFQEGGFTIPA